MALSDILSIASLVFAIFIFLFFTLYPAVKNFLFKKILNYIKRFYELYSVLNPCYLYTTNIKRQNENLGQKVDEINDDLMNQEFIRNMFPWYDFILERRDNCNYLNPFKINIGEYLKKLTIKEFYSTSKKWKLANKKLNSVKSFLESLNYISVDQKTGNIIYRGNNDLYFNLVNKSQISLCPSFNELKLFGIKSHISSGSYEQKINFNDVLKLFENKRFIDELKSDDFCISLELNTNIKICCKNINSDKKKFKYSLFFKDNKFIYIQNQFHKWLGKWSIKTEELKELNKHYEWIRQTFDIPINELPNLKEDDIRDSPI